MIRPFSRRDFLKSLGAGASMIATPGLARTSQSIQGADKGELRLVFYTDVHADGREETSAAMALAAEVINKQNSDLVLCGGDLIAGGFTSNSNEVAPRWDAYLSMMRGINAEHHAVLGNHDLVGARPLEGSAAEDPRLEFKKYLGLSRTFGSFDALGYRFIMLDALRISAGEQMYDGWVSLEQMEWIKELLASTTSDMPIVLLLHMPLLTGFWSATRGGTFQAQPNRVVVNNAEVLKLFDRYNLILVLQGHLHVTEYLYWRGTNFLTGGAICGGWWRGPYFDTVEGFKVITLKNDRIEWYYQDFGWKGLSE